MTLIHERSLYKGGLTLNKFYPVLARWRVSLLSQDKCHVDFGERRMRPMPFEINFEIPRHSPQRTQIVWTVHALKSILDSYRTVLAIQQNI
jgi:hypothetical protein